MDRELLSILPASLNLTMKSQQVIDRPWVITLASHWDFKLKKKVPDAIERGTGLDDLLDQVQIAYEAGIETEISFDIDPTPQYLYDETGGEPAISADERWQNAFDEKRRLAA